MTVSTHPTATETPAPHPTPAPPSAHAPTRRIGGLDGLRAIAIGAVLLFHAEFYAARGGYLGVDLFFVISGFLITGLLANEIESTGRLNLGAFYWRRAKRLLPASWLMVAAAILIASWIAVDALPRLRGDGLASLFYVTNWELLSVHVSYFESTGRPPLLQHLWSLAIEEQFYLVWALLVPLGIKAIGRRATAIVAVALAIASAAWMALLATKMGYPGQGDPSRLYFGTDTHGFPLFFGAALGLLWRPERLGSAVGPGSRASLWGVGLLGLTGFAYLVATLGEQTPTLYPWGLLLGSAASLALIAAASHPAIAFGRWLDCKPMRWIGQRSYGIYLWHWPIYMLTRPGIDLRDWSQGEAFALRLALSIGIAALSYDLMETPIRNGALDRLWREWRTGKDQPDRGARRRRAALQATAIAIPTAACLLAVGNVIERAPTHETPSLDVRQALHMDTPTVASGQASPNATAEIAAPASALVPVKVDVAPVKPGGPKIVYFTGHDVTAVGDSVLLGSSQLLLASLRGSDVHATVGWQAADVIKELETLKKAGQIRPVVLLHLGTNGYVYENQLRQMLSLLKDCKRVVLVDTHVPRRWMEANNLLIDKVAPEYANVVVVHWNEVSEGQPDFFVSDGVHLTPIGQRAYIAQIMRVGYLEPDADHPAPKQMAIDPTRSYATLAGDLSSTLVLAPRPPVSDKYWNKLAQCETDSQWHTDGALSGGLAIRLRDWQRWGGLAFAKTPAQADPAQQIEVANRISTQGWIGPDGVKIEPVGFAGWRCVAAMPPPRSHVAGSLDLTYTRDSVIAQNFHLDERGVVVSDLQAIIGTKRDGIYSRATQKKYLAWLANNQLPLDRAGPLPAPPPSPHKARHEPIAKRTAPASATNDRNHSIPTVGTTPNAAPIHPSTLPSTSHQDSRRADSGIGSK